MSKMFVDMQPSNNNPMTENIFKCTKQEAFRHFPWLTLLPVVHYQYFVVLLLLCITSCCEATCICPLFICDTRDSATQTWSHKRSLSMLEFILSKCLLFHCFTYTATIPRFCLVFQFKKRDKIPPEKRPFEGRMTLIYWSKVVGCERWTQHAHIPESSRTRWGLSILSVRVCVLLTVQQRGNKTKLCLSKTVRQSVREADSVLLTPQLLGLESLPFFISQ